MNFVYSTIYVLCSYNVYVYVHIIFNNSSSLQPACEFPRDLITSSLKFVQANFSTLLDIMNEVSELHNIYNVNSRPRQENTSAYHTKSICHFNPVIPGIAKLCFYEVLNNICNVNSGNSQLF